jgi:hypothetical protein
MTERINMMPPSVDDALLKLRKARTTTIRGSTGVLKNVSVGQLFVKLGVTYELCEKEEVDGKLRVRIMKINGIVMTRLWNPNDKVILK